MIRKPVGNPEKERVCIMIDGGNFYHLALKRMGVSEIDFDFEAFIKFLAGDREICQTGKRYYTGTVREKEGDAFSKKMMAQQTKLLTTLSGAGWEIKTSKLKTKTEEINVDSKIQECAALIKAGIRRITLTRDREKGVDVKIATDMLAGAFDDQYDTVIIISSDTDLVPAIDWVRMRTNKKVEYVGFSFPNATDPSKNIRPVMALISKTDVQRTLVEADLTPFVIPKLVQ